MDTVNIKTNINVCTVMTYVKRDIAKTQNVKKDIQKNVVI